MTKGQKELMEMLDSKFDEFKKSLLNDLSADIQKVVDNHKKEIQLYFDDKSRELEKVEDLADSVAVIHEHVRKLQESNDLLKKQNSMLYDKVDDLEQYGRRQCLRIYGVPPKEGETSDDVRKEVLGIVRDANMNIPENFVDRAHRIGKEVVKDGVKKQAIIVRFNNFHYRTLFYRARKDTNVGVFLDLTKTRLDILNQAREYVKHVSGIKFVYSDINCSLRVLTESGKHIVFKSLANLEKLVAGL